MRRERDGVALRFRLAAELARMNFGEARTIEHDDAFLAWPPTGDHDRSIDAAIRALALAAGGNRPETSYTTKERIENDLDETFVVEGPALMDGSYYIHRPIRGCPYCQGSGQRYDDTLPPLLSPGMADKVTTSTIKIIPCDHRPRSRKG